MRTNAVLLFNALAFGNDEAKKCAITMLNRGARSPQISKAFARVLWSPYSSLIGSALKHCDLVRPTAAVIRAVEGLLTDVRKGDGVHSDIPALSAFVGNKAFNSMLARLLSQPGPARCQAF